MFRKLLMTSAVLAAAAIGGSAAAQDAGDTWTGFYAGVNLGGAWTTSCASVTATSAIGDATYASSNCPHPASFIGGGQLGYNYQISQFVIGLEGDISGATSKSESVARSTTGNATIPAGIYTLSGTHTPSAIGTIRARLGYSLADNKALIYFTGGGIFAGSSGDATLGYVSPDGTQIASFTGSHSGTRTGWALGGGLEYKVTPRWSVKAEDIFANAGNLTAPTVCNDGVGGTVCHNFSNVTFRSSGNAGNVNIFRIGVNYKFF